MHFLVANHEYQSFEFQGGFLHLLILLHHSHLNKTKVETNRKSAAMRWINLVLCLHFSENFISAYRSSPTTKRRLSQPSMQGNSLLIPDLLSSTAPSESPSVVVQPSSKPFITNIVLELPGEEILNETETTSFQEAISDVINSPSCRSNEIEIDRVTIFDQSISSDKEVLYLSIRIESTTDRTLYAKAKRTMTDCIKANGRKIKIKFLISVGRIESVPQDDNNGLKPNNTIMILIISGSVMLSLGLLMLGICYELKRRKKGEKDIDILFGNEDTIPNLEDFKNNPVPFSQSQDGDLELGNNIEHILSVVLSGPDEASQKSNEYQYSSSTREANDKKQNTTGASSVRQN